MNSLVSIIIPVRDRAILLRSCLECFKKQTYKNIEIVIVDGNSTDNTVEVAKEYTDKVYIFDKKGDYRSAQKNMAAQKATGKYILTIDSDMELSEKVVENCVKKMEKNDNASGIIIPEESFGQGFWAQCKKLEKSFYIGVDWMEAARFMCREDYLKVGGYNIDLISGEDWDLSQKIGDLGNLERINDLIYHNDGRISLFKTIKKKYYYAGEFAKYMKTSEHKEKVGAQTGILNRYKLFLNNPKKLFKNPIIGLGMLFMKTCELGFGGVGYLVKR